MTEAKRDCGSVGSLGRTWSQGRRRQISILGRLWAPEFREAASRRLRLHRPPPVLGVPAPGATEAPSGSRHLQLFRLPRWDQW